MGLIHETSITSDGLLMQLVEFYCTWIVLRDVLTDQESFHLSGRRHPLGSWNPFTNLREQIDEMRGNSIGEIMSNGWPGLVSIGEACIFYCLGMNITRTAEGCVSSLNTL